MDGPMLYPKSRIALRRTCLRVTVFILSAQWFATTPQCQAPDQPKRATPPELIVHTGHTSEITAIDFAHKKLMLAAGSYDGAVKLWDTTSGLELSEIGNGGGGVGGIRFFPSDERVAVGSHDGKVRLWDLSPLTCAATLDAGGPVWRLAVSRDGKWLAAATESGHITVWNALTLAAVLELQDAEHMKDLVFTPEDSLRSVNTGDSTPTTPHADVIWAIPSGAVLKERNDVIPIALNADGTEGVWGSLPTMEVQKSTETLEGDNGAPIASWNFETQQDETMQEEIVDAELNPGGDLLATVSMDMSGNTHEFTFARILDAHTGKVLHTLSGRDENAAMNTLIRFSDDGRTLALVAGNDIGFFDSATGLRIGQIAWAGVSSRIQFSPQGHWLGMIVDRTLKLWDLSTGSLAMNLGPVSGAARIAFSSDDRYVASWNFDPETLNLHSVMKRFYVKVWDLEDGGEVRSATEEGPLNDVEFSPDGKDFAYAISAVVEFCDIKTAKSHSTMNQDLDYNTSHWINFSANGSELLDLSEEYNIHEWNLPQGTLRSARKEAGEPGGIPEMIAGSAGSRFFAYSDYKQTVRTWNFLDGSRSSLLIKDAGIDVLALSPDGRTLAVGGDSNRILVLCDARPLRERTRVSLTGGVRSLGYSPDGKWLAIGLDTGETELVSTSTNQVAARIFAMGSTPDWMMITPSGEFDGSDRGLHTLLAWQFDQQQYPADRFFNDFDAPRLLPRVLGGEVPVPALSLEALGYPPAVHIVSDKLRTPDTGLVDIDVKGTDQGGGLKEFRLLQNGKLIGVQPVAVTAGSSAEAHFTATLAPGENRFDATALNLHDVESEEDVAWIDHGHLQQKPVLHILSIGINEYADSNLNLEYARPDSEAIAEAFRAHAGNLFSRVDVSTLADKSATADAIRESLRDLQTKSAPGDVVVLYLAGHGKNIGDQFFFFAYDADTSSGAMPGGVLSAEEIGKALFANPALKQLLIFDTCESGAAVEQIASLANSARALNAAKTLSRGIGINVLSATTAVEREKETESLGHSRLAAAILEGIASNAHTTLRFDQERTISVSSLISYVNARMSQRDVHGVPGRQTGTSEETGVDFPIAVP
jgi:WD40 repeat protein